MGELCDEGLQRVLEVTEGLLLRDKIQLVFILELRSHCDEIVEQHRHAHLEHDPHRHDNEGAYEEGRLPLNFSVTIQNR